MPRKNKAIRILIADDYLVTRRLLRETLERAGYEVLAVENGRLALECLVDRDGPRLALLDWLMPEIDGLGVCREIRRHPERPYIYIILLSAKNAKEDVISGLESGADDYLSKPCDSEELKARLRAGERISETRRQINPRCSSRSAYAAAKPRVLSGTLGSLCSVGNAAHRL